MGKCYELSFDDNIVNAKVFCNGLHSSLLVHYNQLLCAIKAYLVQTKALKYTEVFKEGLK